MSIVFALLIIAVGLSAAMAVACLVAVRSGRSGWIDTIWSFCVGLFGAIAALLPYADNEILPRQWLVAGLALAWSLRLGFHIAMRTAGAQNAMAGSASASSNSPSPNVTSPRPCM